MCRGANTPMSRGNVRHGTLPTGSHGGAQTRELTGKSPPLSPRQAPAALPERVTGPLAEGAGDIR
jgi:hypothetical protein